MVCIRAIHQAVAIGVDHGWVVSCFNQVVDAVIVAVQVLEVGPAIAIGVGGRVLRTVVVCVELTGFRGSLHIISQTICAKALGQVDYAVIIGVKCGDLTCAQAALVQITDTIVIAVQVEAVGYAVAVGVTTVASRELFNAIGDAVVVIIQIVGIRHTIAVIVGSVTKVVGSAVDHVGDAVAIAIGGVIHAAVVVHIQGRGATILLKVGIAITIRVQVLVIRWTIVVAVGQWGAARIAETRITVDEVLDTIAVAVRAVHNAVFVGVFAWVAPFNHVVDIIVVAVQVLEIRCAIAVGVGRQGVARIPKRGWLAIRRVGNAITIGVRPVHDAVAIRVSQAAFQNVIDAVVVTIQILSVGHPITIGVAW